MLSKFKKDLVDVVKGSAEALNDEEALAIIEICKQAIDREIANVTEDYLSSRISGEEEAQDAKE